jgi:3'-phosphoadenosine 5'-phosphosulfate sulfotransferase (PAPS reductase)/FAD synthetase
MIAVWFSCGAASAAALKLTLDRFPGEEVRAINQPIAEEHPDNRRFLRDVAEWCGIEIEEFTASKYPTASAVDVWELRKAMVFPHGAPCTVHLKKDARREWEVLHKPDQHVLGFTVEERDRHDRFTLTERENVIPVLIDAAMTKGDCGDMIRAAGIKLPAIYDHGFPNANCLGCVKATSPTYWNHLRREFPEVFAERAEQSRRLGARLVRVDGGRVFLDELHPAAKGSPMWQMPACSLFCEEWTPPTHLAADSVKETAA